MIILARHDDRYVALHNCFAYRERIKELGDYPNVRWDAELKCWLLDLRLLPALYSELGAVIAPMPADFWLDLPMPRVVKARKRRRKSYLERAEEQAKAAAVGRAIVEMGRMK